MQQLNKKQKQLLDQFIVDYHAGSGGRYPIDIEAINPFVWAEIEQANDHETIVQNANRFIHDQVCNKMYRGK